MGSFVVAVAISLTLTIDGASAETPAESGGHVVLIEQRPDLGKHVVVKRGSPPGDFLIVTSATAARAYEIFIASQRQLLLVDTGPRVTLFDGAGRPVPRASFDMRVIERELRSQLRRVGRRPESGVSARAAGLPALGAVIGIKKGLDACRKLEKTFVLRPIAKACRDYLERKIFKFMAKIVGVKTATALLTCSQAMPRKTPWLARQIAKMFCG